MPEYGIFNDEGCIERQFYSREDVDTAAASYDPEDDVRVEEMCRDHADQEQPANGCEFCNEEEA